VKDAVETIVITKTSEMITDTIVDIAVSEKPEMDKKWFSVSDLMGMDDNPQDYCLWEPFLLRTGIAAIAGPSDCGKSTWARQLALSIVTRQTEFLNFPLNVKHGKVCYIATEDGPFDTKRVLKKQLDGFDTEVTEALKFLFDPATVMDDLTVFLTENSVDLIVIDAWADIFDGNPNNNIDVRKALAKWSDLAKKHECCILMLHHNVKHSEKSNPDKNKLIGSQALEAKVRCVLDLRLGAPQQSEDVRHLTILKANHLPPGMKGKPNILKLDGDSLLFTNTSKFADFAIATKGKIYDKEIWLKRFEDVRAAVTSDRKAIGILVEKFPDEEVPKRSWFIDNFKVVGQSISKEKGQPTIPDSMSSLLDPEMDGAIRPD
jgi:hypothetical protein